MDLIRDYKHVNNEYTKKIRITKYTEGENITIEKKGVKDICEIIISQNDQEYNTKFNGVYAAQDDFLPAPLDIYTYFINC